MKIDSRAMVRLRRTLLLCSCTYWIALPLSVVFFPDHLASRTVLQDLTFSVATSLMYLGGIAWFVVAVHTVRARLLCRAVPTGWLIALFLFGPFASPFYVIERMPAERNPNALES